MDREQDIVKKIKEFLKKLKIVTKVYESLYSTLDLVLPLIDYILAQFKKVKDSNDDDIIALIYNSNWVKIDKYYKLSDLTPVYIVTIILHPSRKQRYIKRHWEENQVLNTR